MNDPHPWSVSLVTLYSNVWTLLARGVKDRRADMRHLTLATTASTNRPQARTVVMRGADRQKGTIDVHTDLHAQKVQELSKSPYACLHFWDRSAHLQIRMEAKATILQGTDVAQIWANVPELSRTAYGGMPPPGTLIAEALDYEKIPNSAAFVVLSFQIEAMDVLHLGRQHRRARFCCDDNWAGQWLVP